MSINEGRIQELEQLLGNGLKNVIDEYLVSSQDAISRIQRYLETQDVDALCKQLHRLKGSSANLGIDIVSDACESLETDLKNNTTNNISARIDEIVTHLKCAWEKLEN
jgi:HPt (histidine-containing phosphotransfer) domain-containing protein